MPRRVGGWTGRTVHDAARCLARARRHGHPRLRRAARHQAPPARHPHPVATGFGVGQGRAERARQAQAGELGARGRRRQEEELSAALAWAGVKAVAMERLLLAVVEEGEFPRCKPKSAARTDASTVQKWVERGILEVEEREPARPSRPGTASLPVLSDAQASAYNAVHAGLVAEKPVLLHGVTGSGKTEIYTHLIAEVLAAGQQVLFLVPEIALTTQLIERLRRFFGDVVHVYHSRFSDRERTETWMNVLNPKSGQLIVGARSAVLLPLPKVGLVVVDEEHEPSFKQHDPAPRYHARDVALWMSSRQHVPLVMGSATPAVETQWLGGQGHVEVVSLTERFGGAMLPEIFLADLRKEHKQRSMRGGFQQDAARRDGGDVERGASGHFVPKPPRLRSGLPMHPVRTRHVLRAMRHSIGGPQNPWRASLSPLWVPRASRTHHVHCVRQHGAQAARFGHGAHRGRVGRIVSHGAGGADGFGHHEKEKGPRHAARRLRQLGIRHLGWDPNGVQGLGLRPCGACGGDVR